MRSQSLFVILLSAWGSACSDARSGTAGGQSGNEGPPQTCGGTYVALDDETPAGTAQALFDSFSSAQLAAFRWYAPDRRSSYSNTTLTLSMSGAPGTARYFSQGDLCPPAGTLPNHEPILTVAGVMRCETADGSFNETISGVARATLQGNVKLDFSGALPVAGFGGTYDIAAAAAPYADAELFLETNQPNSFFPLNNRGQLAVASPPGSSMPATTIADWTISADAGPGDDIKSGDSGGESGSGGGRAHSTAGAGVGGS